MTYQEAKNIQVGNCLLMKTQNYKATVVLEISEDVDAKAVFFRCTDGVFHHTAVVPAMSTDELAKLYINKPDTKVRIYHNNDSGEWLYSVEVVDSNGFWLTSFYTEQECLEYIHANNLQLEA